MARTSQSEFPTVPESVDESFVRLPAAEISSGRKRAKSEDDLVRAFLVLFVPVLLLDLIFRAAGRAFWFDEILTVLVARQPNASGIWNLLRNGITTHPPLMYLIEHWLGRMGGNERIVFRLPSMAAFVSIAMCMFVFLKRRTGPLIALISTASLLLTIAFDVYAFEARPYELMVACIALALVAYDKADSLGGASLLALSLVAASSVNFYAGFAFFPLGLAELARVVTERKLRVKVWVAFLAGLLPYLVFWPLLREQEVLFGAHNWARPTFWKFANSFGELIHLSTVPACGIFAAAMLYLVYLAIPRRGTSRPLEASCEGFSLPDLALAVGFLAIPIVTYAIASFGHGAIVGRYVIAAALGIPLALAVTLSRLEKPAVLAVGFLILFTFLFQEWSFWNAALVQSAGHIPTPPAMEVAASTGLPVVISNGLLYLPIWYAASEKLKPEVYFLAEPQEQYAATGTDTWTLLLQMLPKYLPIQVQSFSQFTGSHRKFVLFSSGDAEDYWPGLLVGRGYKMRPIYIGPPSSAALELGVGQSKTILYLVDLDDAK